MDTSDHWKQARLILLLAICLVGLYFFAWRRLQFFEVPSGSMLPTLQVGDRIGTLKEETYARGDIIVFWDPEGAEHLVKRIVGVPGDTLMVAGGALTINTHYVSEPYIAEPMEFAFDEPITVSAGEVFVMGDNRNHSYDSGVTKRSIPLDQVVGKLQFIYYPFERAGEKPSYPTVNVAGQ